ncbi:hypothetical protein BFJ63_vAg17310 [Fusarium oxysporum f. sp. narcissi]|uniref:Uncharacterized protein n=1 Tax=Fusarium oxysporum f. sp. narcissi TaxID=451672 RepID=A0A4Q2V030_FUSOX|nr:hypothetical protein BFJ63_vAg17310 [Fusarium oxysporum f. sp. narcissi]
MPTGPNPRHPLEVVNSRLPSHALRIALRNRLASPFAASASIAGNKSRRGRAGRVLAYDSARRK